MDFTKLDTPRVLIIAMSGIGNLLMQTPMIRRIKEANKTAEISILTAPRGTKEVLTGNPLIKDVLVGIPKPNLRKRIEMIREISENKFDIGIVAFPGQLITSSSLLFFGKTKKRIGHEFDYYFLKKSGLFLTDAIKLEQTHDVQQNLNLVSSLGVSTDATSTEYDFPLNEEDHKIAENFIEEHKIVNRNFIGIHPGTNGDLVYKRWPKERWVNLSDFLSETYKAHILVFGGKDENHLKNGLITDMRHKAINVELSLRGTAALIKKCNFFVSNDSGLMHIAVSQKVPTFGLFGPTDEGRTAPWGKYGHVIRAEGTRPNYDVTRLRQISQSKDTDASLLALDEKSVFEKILSSQRPL